jgi:hypothetical protein
MTLPRELLDITPKGLAWLLLTTLQISGVARPQVSGLVAAGEDLLEILPVINCVSQQVVESSPSGVG